MTEATKGNEGRSRLSVYIDGASRGNPGRAGAGVWIADQDGKRLVEICRYLGYKTNNEAEYWALLLGLKEAKRLGGEAIRVLTDSELVARQVNGLYRVRNPNLKSLYQAVVENLKSFSSFEIVSVPRERNREADRLANQAIDRRVEREEKGEIRGETDDRSA
jgi:ribonuclease HI